VSAGAPAGTRTRAGAAAGAKRGPLGVGIIGAGVISAQYLRNLTGFPDVEVLFVADLDVARASARALEFGIPGHGTVAELLAEPGIEIVVNLTTPAAHAEVGLQILAAGKHVWTEKPLALDLESGRRLLDAATDRGLRVASAPDTFLGAGLQTGLRAVRRGAIGEPLTGLALFQSPGPEAWHPNPEFLFAAGGGPLFDMGPYYLTLLVQVFGPAARVTASASTSKARRAIGSGPRAGTEFEVSVPTHHSALIEFAGGASALAVFSFQAHLRRSPLVEVSGTDGSIAFPDPNQFAGDTQLATAGGDETLSPAGPVSGRGTGVLELARAIRSGATERASGALGYHVLDIMVSISRSAREGRPVDVASTVDRAATLPEDWDPSAATLTREREPRH